MRALHPLLFNNNNTNNKYINKQKHNITLFTYPRLKLYRFLYDINNWVFYKIVYTIRC